MNFCSDNISAVHPAILQSLASANNGPAAPYGQDSLTADLHRQAAKLFERAPEDLRILAVSTGTAANGLGLSLLAPPWGGVLCHRRSHIQIQECGAPELFTGGAKLIPLDGAQAKITPEAVDRAMRLYPKGFVHQVQPSALSITQATETGSVYTLDEIQALASACRRHGLRLHMDGARFANALAFLDVSPADAAWRAGVDVLSLGATKNGAMAADAVVVFDPALAESLPFRSKRAGHLASKHRFLSAQLLAYLDIWLDNARRANSLAAQLATGLTEAPHVEVRHPVETNQLIVRMPQFMADALRAKGFSFYDALQDGESCYRLVTAWDTRPQDVQSLLEAVRAAA